MPTKTVDLSLRFPAEFATWSVCFTMLGLLFFAAAFPPAVNAQGQQAAMEAARRAAMEAQGGSSGYGEMEPGYDETDMYDEGDLYGSGMDDQGMGDPYGESASGYGYGGQSNSRGGVDLNPSPLVMLNVFQLDWSPLGERVQQLVSSSSASQQPVVLGPVLRNEAHVAYRYGNLPLALQLFHGFLARGSNAAEQQMDQIKFSKHFRKPLWHLKVGVSLGLHGDTSTTNPSPISGSGSPRGMDGGMGMEGEMGMGMGMEGEMGMDSGMMENSRRGMQEGMREGMAGMGAGMGMDDMGMDSSGMYDEDMGMSGMGMSGRGGRNQTAAPSIPKAEMTDSEVDSKLKNFLGLVADTVKSGLSKRIADGKFGHALTDVEAESKTQGHTVNGETVDDAAQAMWIPSVLFVGEGNSRDTIKTAHNLELDLLFHFDVGLKENRVGTVSNISRVKVMDARTGKTLVSSAALDNNEVERMTRVGRGSPAAYVDEQMKSLWSVVDERLTLSELPTLSPEVARKRVAQVLGDQSMSPLRKLAEIRYYGYRGWLTADEVEQAFEITGGPDAMRVLHGSDTQAIEAIHKLVVLSEANDS